MPGFVDSYGNNLTGLDLLARKQPRAAIPALELAIAEYPNDFYLLFRAGDAYAEVGEREKARLKYAEALRLQPANVEVKSKLDKLNGRK